ncbi:uncharacterized protein LOC117921907 [Vitis riparia]|uniref:uncharacterized protein LOC117921907 n=1 Tax=Vitis riparia TaxID=96939 RepID=UPI00155A6278|nr:uncharacterized protein LOC117921907 [Vitis riparia]
MEVESSFSSIAPLVFDGDNYRFWAIRMKTYLDVMDLWEAVEEDYEIIPLPSNPTMAQIKHHKERKIRKSKVKACLYVVVSSTIFTYIMSFRSTKAIGDYLKIEYEEDERIRGMQVLNLIRNFELQKMKEAESIKEYFDRLLNIANRVRLLGSSLLDSRIVEKILVTVLERFEASITALENTKDLSMIIFAELLNALQAQEQRRVIRQDGVIEGALLIKHHVNAINNRNKKGKKHQGSMENIQPTTTRAKLETKGTPSSLSAFWWQISSAFQMLEKT